MSFADAVGLASAIVQLVQFSTKVITGAQDIYKSAQLKEHAELDLIQSDLNTHLEDIAKRELGAPDLGLDELASLCRKIGGELQDALQKLRAREGGSRVARMGRSVSLSLKTVLSRDKIGELQQRLEAVRDEIQFKLVVLISNQTKELVSAFAITHEQLLNISNQAAVNAQEFKNDVEYYRMTDMEKKLLDSIAAQDHTLHDLAMMLSAESEQQHDRTREEMRSMGDAITEQNVDQHDLTRLGISSVDTNVKEIHTRLGEQRDTSLEHNMHLTRVEDSVGDIRQRFETQQEDARKEKTQAAARERKKRLWESVNRSLHPTDRRGRRLRLTEGERAARYAMAASLISIHYSSEAVKSMRGPDGRIKLPVDPNKLPEVKLSQIKIPKIKAPQIDTREVKRTFDMIGGHIQQTSKTGFTATQTFFRGFPKYFQPVSPPAEPKVEKDVDTNFDESLDDQAGLNVVTQVSQIQLIDLEEEEDIPPPKPPRPVKSSPLIPPKPPLLQSYRSAPALPIPQLTANKSTRRASDWPTSTFNQPDNHAEMHGLEIL